MGDAGSVREKMIAACPQARTVYDQFVEVDHIEYDASMMPRPSPDKVLREKLIDTQWCLVPASPEMAFYLRHVKDLSHAGPSIKDRWDVVSKLVAPTTAIATHTTKDPTSSSSPSH